ncbi:unnamed protein product, partial [Symbiodinium sp. CCMP2456]
GVLGRLPDTDFELRNVLPAYIRKAGAESSQRCPERSSANSNSASRQPQKHRSALCFLRFARALVQMPVTKIEHERMKCIYVCMYARTYVMYVCVQTVFRLLPKSVAIVNSLV